MDARQKIREHGSHLMSLASIGQCACACLMGWNLGVRSWAPEITAKLSPAEWWFFAAGVVLVWASQAWTLSRLRAIGKQLYAGGGISHAMAGAWARLGNALALTAVLMALPIGPALQEPHGRLDLVLRLDAGSLYFVAIGCVCVFSVAHLLDQAAQFREDNEAIV
jgi:hypothetical protein